MIKKTNATSAANFVRHVLVFFGFIAAWELAIWFFEISKIVIPAPSDVSVALFRDLSTSGFYWHSWVTLYEILAGFLLGAFSGLLVGFVIALSPTLNRFLYPYVIAFQTVPKVAIAPIIVIWFGYGVTSKIVITATVAFFPLVANTIVGLRAAPAVQIEMLTAHTATSWQVFRLVRLPSALPYIFVGLNIAIVLAVIGAIVGEFVGSKAGLGFLILQKNFNFDMAGTFGVLIVLSSIGIILHWIVSEIQRRVIFWMDLSGENLNGV